MNENPPILTQFALPDPNAAPLNLTQLVQLLNSLVSSAIQGSYIPYVISADTPGVNDHDKAWIKLDSNGRPLGTFIWYSGNWRREYNGMIGEVRGYTGNPTIDFDANGLGIVGGIYDGWHICNGKDGVPDFSDQFIIGAHMNDVGHPGYDAGQWVTWVSNTSGQHTGGVRDITLGAGNTYRPAEAAVTAQRFTATGNAPDPGGDLLATGGGGTRYELEAADPGNPTPPAISVINPFICMAWMIFVGY